MRLPPPDPLSTVLLYLAAIIMALKEALSPGSAIAKQVPGLTMAGLWSYVPAILLAIAFVIWIARGAQRPARIERTLGEDGKQVAVYETRRLLPAHEPLDSGQVHHLLYAGMFLLFMIALNALSRCDSEPSPASVEAASAAAKR